MECTKNGKIIETVQEKRREKEKNREKTRENQIYLKNLRKLLLTKTGKTAIISFVERKIA